MSRLLSPVSEPNENGRIQNITPESAGWEYVGFEVYSLKAGQSLTKASENNEVCLVILTGKADVKTKAEFWQGLGERESVFDKKAPYAVYVPPSDQYEVKAVSDLELAVCKAPAEGRFPARLITPEDASFETRGIGTNQRHVCNILFGNMAAEKLLVCEVITPGGNWSSYPPHKHDVHREDEAGNVLEADLEEIYYYKIDKPMGLFIPMIDQLMKPWQLKIEA